MRPLSSWQAVAYMVGGVLMVVGAGCYAFLFMRNVAAVVYLLGAVAFVAMQVAQRYDGDRLVVRRLRGILFFAHACFVLAGVLMLEEQFGLLGSLLAGRGGAYVTFVTLTYGKWVVLLLIASMLEIYVTHRLSSELEKEQQ